MRGREGGSARARMNGAGDSRERSKVAEPPCGAAHISLSCSSRGNYLRKALGTRRDQVARNSDRLRGHPRSRRARGYNRVTLEGGFNRARGVFISGDRCSDADRGLVAENWGRGLCEKKSLIICYLSFTSQAHTHTHTHSARANHARRSSCLFLDISLRR